MSCAAGYKVIHEQTGETVARYEFAVWHDNAKKWALRNAEERNQKAMQLGIVARYKALEDIPKQNC